MLLKQVKKVQGLSYCPVVAQLEQNSYCTPRNRAGSSPLGAIFAEDRLLLFAVGSTIYVNPDSFSLLVAHTDFNLQSSNMWKLTKVDIPPKKGRQPRRNIRDPRLRCYKRPTSPIVLTFNPIPTEYKPVTEARKPAHKPGLERKNYKVKCNQNTDLDTVLYLTKIFFDQMIS